MKTSLIVPMAADCKGNAGVMPYIFHFASDGTLLCIKSIQGLDLNRFTAIYFTILGKHDECYSLSLLLRLQFHKYGMKNAHVVILDKPTANQAETVYRTVKQEQIDGIIFVKDADGYFNGDFITGNSIAIYPLDRLDMVNPHNKSYVQVDDQFYITNIIENKIISRWFNAGGYIFEDASTFCHYYERLQTYSPLFMSHIVYSMLLDKISFRPMEVEEYQDWGTENMLHLSTKI